MSGLSSKLAAASMPFEDVRICLDGQLNKERDDALAELAEAGQSLNRASARRSSDVRLTDPAPDTSAEQAAVDDARAKVEAIEERMRAATATLRVFGVDFETYNKYLSANPPRKGKQEDFNNQTFFLYVAERTAKYLESGGELSDIEPAEWEDLRQRLTDGDHDKLADAIVTVNRINGRQGVDFLFDASGKTTVSSETSELPEPSE
jgi:hypothetical protein